MINLQHEKKPVQETGDPNGNISTYDKYSAKYARGGSEDTREFYLFKSHLDLRPRASAWTQEGLPGRESYLDRDPRESFLSRHFPRLTE